MVHMPSMTLFWPTSPTSSYEILCLTHFVPAIPTFLQFLPFLSFFNSPSLLFIPQDLGLAALQSWVLFPSFLGDIQMTT